MRILQLSWEYPPLVYGGLGRHVHALAEAQTAAGHDVTVLTQSVDGGVADSRVSGVRVVRVRPDPPDIAREDLLAWVLAFGHAQTRAGLRLREQLRPDVVHAHDWLTAHAGTALAQAFDVPLVATVHATESGRHQGWLPSPLSRAVHTTEAWLTSQAARVVTCSESMREEVVRLFDPAVDTVDVIANGIDLGRWVPPTRRRRARDRQRWAPAGGPLVVYAGRLEYEKGVHTLLEATSRLRRRHPGLQLLIAGKGTYGDELRALVRRARVGRAVTFAGFLRDDELAALVGAADVAVVPSLYEPFGMAALEAAALGTPLVASAIGGLRELVEPGVTGLTFTPADPAALARAVSRLLDDPLSGRAMARAARSVLAVRNDWSNLAGQTVVSYRRAVRAFRRAPTR